MKAITICQPYAELIACGEKRVENRTWPTNHRGMLYIHAGKNRSWLDIEFTKDSYEIDRPTGIYLEMMDFGALIATGFAGQASGAAMKQLTLWVGMMLGTLMWKYILFPDSTVNMREAAFWTAAAMFSSWLSEKSHG